MSSKQFLYAAVGAAVVAAALAAVILVSLYAKGATLDTGGLVLLVLVAFFGGGVSWLLVVAADSKEGHFGGVLETIGVAGFAVTTWVVLAAGLPDLTHFVSDRFSPFKVDTAEPPTIEFATDGELVVSDLKNQRTVVQFVFPTDKGLNDGKIIPPGKDAAEVLIWRQDAAGKKSWAWKRVGPATPK